MERICNDCGFPKNLEADFHKSSYQPIDHVTYRLKCKLCQSIETNRKNKARRRRLKLHKQEIGSRYDSEEALMSRVDSLLLKFA